MSSAPATHSPVQKTIEPTIFELSRPGRVGTQMPACDVPEQPIDDLLPGVALRDELPLPEMAEPDVVRHFMHLSSLNYNVDKGFYPLGSCTMKYNPKINDQAVLMPGFSRVHPYQPEETVQGAIELLYRMQTNLAAILGMDAVSLQPAAGAHGELLGLMLIRAYHEHRGEGHRTIVLVPTAAHGTNPASAARCGYKCVDVNTDPRGLVDVAHLKAQLLAHAGNVAGFMLTNPNTVGLFEEDIREISDLVHEAGGLMYCDGANMNALVGTARPGDMGFDVMHVNLHKTFSVPHGGGGPGSGPVGVRAILEPFLPVPFAIRRDDGSFALATEAERPLTIGKVGPYAGAFLAVVRAYAYIRHYGRERLREISENAVLNANYLRVRLGQTFPVAYDRLCMHECVFTLKALKAKGVKALDVAKRIIDYGYHPPTMYFPLIVPECLMIEPTETESRETIDAFIAAVEKIAEEAETNPQVILDAPHHAPVRRLDEAAAARQLDLAWSPAK
ncbi:MAG: aminomethyl-transferring glycine dehydrogenase subunit GcvPB [Capsulimonadales bacterium]|nr:aminomethyl-transferring glycine dehydrogenase subunit GcvPB [Capsulimonadales bacterium]